MVAQYIDVHHHICQEMCFFPVVKRPTKTSRSWRIIPFSKLSITMVSLSPLSRDSFPFQMGSSWLLNGGPILTSYIHWDDPPSWDLEEVGPSVILWLGSCCLHLHYDRCSKWFSALRLERGWALAEVRRCHWFSFQQSPKYRNSLKIFFWGRSKWGWVIILYYF